MKRSGLVVVAVLGIALGACDSRLEDKPSGSSVGHSSALEEGPVPAQKTVTIGAEMPVTSCNIVTVCRNYGPVRAGSFRVETVSDAPGRSAALRLVDSWEGDLDDVVEMMLDYTSAAIPEARRTALTQALATVKVGETLGLVFAGSPADGPCWGAHAVFRKGQAGGYTNGVMFTQEKVGLDEIGQILSANIRQRNAGEPCSPNVRADNVLTQPAFDDPGVPGPPASTEPLPDDFDPDAPHDEGTD